jgi:hypothetical protein
MRFTGTRAELTKVMSVTRSAYNVLSRSKPQPLPTDALRWSINVRAELKPVTMEDILPSKAADNGK